MDQWWNDTDRGKPMYQDTNFHQKLFSGSAVKYARTPMNGRTAGMIVISHQCMDCTFLCTVH